MMIWDNCVLWTRGVDEKIFHKPNTPVTNTILYVGRVSKEKNIDLFCRLSEEMSYFKFVVVGDGPYRKSLQKRYKNVEFVGFKKGKDLAAYYQQARVMVFPSLTDTFGIVNIESMYCGTPVVAFNVTGPNDIIKQGVNGYLVETEKDMKQAVISACDLSRSEIADSVKKFSWKECYRIFKKHII
jgi:glycosyltransferase involved in cell wall biosynthesis